MAHFEVWSTEVMFCRKVQIWRKTFRLQNKSSNPLWIIKRPLVYGVWLPDVNLNPNFDKIRLFVLRTILLPVANLPLVDTEPIIANLTVNRISMRTSRYIIHGPINSAKSAKLMKINPFRVHATRLPTSLAITVKLIVVATCANGFDCTVWHVDGR